MTKGNMEKDTTVLGYIINESSWLTNYGYLSLSYVNLN